MRSLDDDLGGLTQSGDQGAVGDNTEGLGLVGGEAAHPLVQNGGDLHVGVAVLLQVLVGQLLQGADGSDILNQVAALAVAHGDVLDALLSGQQCLDDGSGVGDAGGNQGAGQGAVGLTVDGNAHFLVQTGEAVHVLPVTDGALHGNVLAVGQVVGDAAALVGGEAAGVGDLGQQTCVGSAVADLHGQVHGLDDLTALGDAVVDGGEAVHHGAAQADGLGDAVLSLGVAVLTGVRVDGGGQQVGLAVLFQVLHQLDVLFHNGNTGAGLHQGAAGSLGVQQLLAELAAVGHGLVVVNSFLQIHVLAGGPLGQDFLTQGHKFAFSDFLIPNIHAFLTPFS